MKKAKKQDLEVVRSQKHTYMDCHALHETVSVSHPMSGREQQV